MPLHCLSYVEPRHGSHRERQFDEVFVGSRVLLFDPRIERGGRSIGDRWRQLDSAVRAVDLVIVRGSREGFGELVAADDLLPNQLRDVPVLALSGSWRADRPEPALTQPSWSLASPLTPAVDVLRHHELLTVVLESHAVSREPGCHYLLPSSRVHAEAFIRLADALDDHTDLVRLADWILPHLADGCALLGDNGSLLGLLTAVRHEAHRRFGWQRVPIATLREYPHDIYTVRAFLEAFEAAEDWDRMLCLVTVGSNRRVARLFGEATDLPSEVIVLCATDDGVVGASDCMTRCVIGRWELDEEGRCPECKNSHTLEIHPRTYEVRAALRRSAELVDVAEGTRCKPFWEAVDRTSAVGLHVWASTAASPAPRVTSRSRSMSPSCSRIRGSGVLASIVYASSLVQTSRSSPATMPPTRWQHLSATPTASPATTSSACRGDRLPLETIARLRAAENVLIADDALITAQTLVGLRLRIYAAGEPHLDIPTWGFVAVMRPPTSLERDYARKTFTAPSGKPERPYENRLSSGFDLLLPGPGVAHCQWCAERGLLADRLDDLHGEAADLAKKRLDRLRATPPARTLAKGGMPGSITEAAFGALVGKLPAEAIVQRLEQGDDHDVAALMLALLGR